ncbi:TerB family tellurite resistance protein [Chryseobacterium sp.]|uniref:tellurite resistance TerB family protein n=1 Tax=Chryseobacterium sp. TaxID=1871047 RepID=UPI000EF0FD4E|nr:TerB family tellurite resistance protein [Chryseobacterium sp.]HCA08143.1 hypothetical protein [Chryseobacterium sp.]
MEKLISWDQIMDQSLKVPGMKIVRTEFLIQAFGAYGNTHLLDNQRPIDLYGEDVIHKIAGDITTKHLRLTTATSTVAGIPGGLAMFGTIPADLGQFYVHILVLAQKLGYIYGWPDLLDENKNVTEGTRNVLTLFVGVMFGAQTANKAISEVGKSFAIQVGKRLPQQALTKTVYYPVVKEVGKWIGIKITKDIFAKGVGKVIPLVGGAVSGGITYISFNAMSKKLQKHLHKEMLLLPKTTVNNFYNDISEDTDYEHINTENKNRIEDLELLSIQACINMAKIDFDLDPAEIDFISSMIEESGLTTDEKMTLLENLRSMDLFKIDFTQLKENELYSIALIENLAAVMHADSVIKPAEKIYFHKVISELGFTKEQMSDYLVLPADEE